MVGLDQYGPERFGRPILPQKNSALKGLNVLVIELRCFVPLTRQCWYYRRIDYCRTVCDDQ